MVGLFKKRDVEPLPAVMDPEVPKKEKEYLKRVQEESKRVLDAPLEGFEVITAQPGWTVLKKPVAGTKVGRAGPAHRLRRFRLARLACSRCKRLCVQRRAAPQVHVQVNIRFALAAYSATPGASWPYTL